MLALTCVDNPFVSSISKFGELPPCLLEQVSVLDIHNVSDVPLPTEWMSSLHNLHSIDLGLPSSLEDSLYRTI